MRGIAVIGTKVLPPGDKTCRQGKILSGIALKRFGIDILKALAKVPGCDDFDGAAAGKKSHDEIVGNTQPEPDCKAVRSV